MERGHEETSTSQARRKRGTPWEMPTVSSLVAAMSVEELGFFKQVPTAIRLEVSNGIAATTIGGANNVVYFTQEQFATGLHFLIPSLVKQFLHFTRAPPALIHPNVFRILMGCIVLNFIYQLDISLVDICFIYTLKLGIGGHLSMLAHNSWLQFVTGLPDSPKSEAKGVVWVKGPWYKTPGSPWLLFDLNQSLLFLDLFQLGGACTPLGRLRFDMPLFYEIFMCFDMPFFSKIFVDRHKRGRLVSWVEKASLESIRRLHEITEGECNHELLLSMKNLQELGVNPFPYIVHVIPLPLPAELIKGEHFILADLLNSIPSSSSQAVLDQEP